MRRSTDSVKIRTTMKKLNESDKILIRLGLGRSDQRSPFRPNPLPLTPPPVNLLIGPDAQTTSTTRSVYNYDSDDNQSYNDASAEKAVQIRRIRNLVHFHFVQICRQRKVRISCEWLMDLGHAVAAQKLPLNFGNALAACTSLGFKFQKPTSGRQPPMASSIWTFSHNRKPHKICIECFVMRESAG